MAMHLLNHTDEPELIDALDRRNLLTEVAQIVAESEAPHVFGVHGDWGSGKTSFLRQLKDYLEQNGAKVEPKRKKAPETYEHLTVVWFEAWRYQYEATPIIALLHEMRSHFTLLTKSGEAFRKLGEVGIRGLLRTFTELSLTIATVGVKFGNIAEKVQAEGEKWEDDHLAVALPTEKIRRFLETSIHQLLGGDATEKKKLRRLVVIVDDLDRCEGEAVVRFLEGIKIYLNLKSCVFVLGINQTEIQRAVAYHLLDEGRNGVLTDEAKARALGYVDKICTFTWKLPILTSKQKTEYTKKLLDKTVLSHAFQEAVAGVVDKYDCLPANPRKVKAFVNTVLHIVRAWNAQKIDQQLDVDKATAICLVALFHLFHPVQLRYLQSYPDFFEHLRRDALKGFSDTKDDRKPMEPTHKFNEEGTVATPLFVDPADSRFCRSQRMIVEAKITDAEL